MIENVSKIAKDYRDKYYYIEYQAIEHGKAIFYAPPMGSSAKMPKCKTKMREIRYRYLKCPSCGYEND